MASATSSMRTPSPAHHDLDPWSAACISIQPLPTLIRCACLSCNLNNLNRLVGNVHLRSIGGHQNLSQTHHLQTDLTRFMSSNHKDQIGSALVLQTTTQMIMKQWWKTRSKSSNPTKRSRPLGPRAFRAKFQNRPETCGKGSNGSGSDRVINPALID
jgi:hypothetical protein